MWRSGREDRARCGQQDDRLVSRTFWISCLRKRNREELTGGIQSRERSQIKPAVTRVKEDVIIVLCFKHLFMRVYCMHLKSLGVSNPAAADRLSCKGQELKIFRMA